jgi:hypothetical protein
MRKPRLISSSADSHGLSLGTDFAREPPSMTKGRKLRQRRRCFAPGRTPFEQWISRRRGFDISISGFVIDCHAILSTSDSCIATHSSDMCIALADQLRRNCFFVQVVRDARTSIAPWCRSAIDRLPTSLEQMTCARNCLCERGTALQRDR